MHEYLRKNPKLKHAYHFLYNFKFFRVLISGINTGYKRFVKAFFKDNSIINKRLPVRIIPLPRDLAVVGREEINAVSEVISSRRLSVFSGGRVKKFEKKFAEFIGSRYAIATSSGTTALHTALAALEIGPGDEVIVPAVTYMATAMSVLHQNAVPKFVDIDLESGNISPSCIESSITKRTKAIIVVHLSGIPAPMKEIMDIAKRYNIFVIEDAAQAMGSSYHGKRVGTIGDIGCFSFYESKNMTTGEGGMLVTNNDNSAYRAKLIINTGETNLDNTPTIEKRNFCSPVKYVCIGYNYRMGEIQAAIGLEQLKKFNRLAGIRYNNGMFLMKALKRFDGIDTPKFDQETKPIFNSFCMRVKSPSPMNRDRLYDALQREGITTFKPDYSILSENPVFKSKVGYGKGNCPFECEKFSSPSDVKTLELTNAFLWNSQALRVPVHPNIRIADLEDIIKAMGKHLTIKL